MRCDRRPWGVLAAVAKGLLILWAVPGQGGRSPLAPTEQQTQALVRLMAEDAQNLFTFFEKDQDLTILNICRTGDAPKWLRWPARRPWGLRRLRRPMVHMDRALQDIIRHQRDLYPPQAEIFRRLNETHRNVRGLLSNLAGLFPVASSRPARRPLPSPTASPGIFRQKLQDCQVLWSYARFMAERSAELEAGSHRRRREKRRSQQEKGRSQREKGRSQREKGRSQREKGRSQQEKGRSQREKGRSQREKGRSQREKGRSQREKGRSQQEKGRSQRGSQLPARP